MTMATTWWQAVNARKGRLAELEIQLKHERFLRDEAARRTAMLELVYVLRRFANAAFEAQNSHEHNEEFRNQASVPTIANLIALGQSSIDLLFKNASLLDSDTRNTVETARDKWEWMYGFSRHFAEQDRVSDTECCLLGGDLEVMELATNDAVYALERRLDAMRFT